MVPLELKLPNAQTQAAMREFRDLMKKRRARFLGAKAVFTALDADVRKR